MYIFICPQVKSGKGPPNRADILLSALNDLMNTLFNHPVDKNLICAVKLLKVLHFFLYLLTGFCIFQLFIDEMNWLVFSNV